MSNLNYYATQSGWPRDQWCV